MALNPVWVRAPASAGPGVMVGADVLRGKGEVNASEAIADLPGVAMVRRGADAGEPVIRGLGWERVPTQVGCHPVYGACPARMDPPSMYVSPGSLQRIVVIKGLPSVTLGPGATGGRLILETEFDRGVNADPGYTGNLRLGWDGGRDGFLGDAAVEGGSDTVDVRGTASTAQLGDYTSGGGVSVPAELTKYAGALSLGWRPTDLSRLFGHVQFTREEDVDYPSLPMDVAWSEATTVTLGYRNEEPVGNMERLELHIGYSMVDHLMNNERKPNRMMMAAETPSTAESWSGKVATDWRWGDDDLFTVGMDVERLDREAIRTRRIAATGAVFKDPIWPEVERELVGAFGEWNGALGSQATLRLGARLDHAASDAGQADARLMLGPGRMTTVRDQYQRFYGSEAGRVDRDEWLSSGNALVEWQLTRERHVYVGIGRTERYPALTEMYYAFAPAPGGYLVGNPALETEKKLEVNAGFTQLGDRGSLSVSVFAAQVDDYILPTRLASEDINGDGQLDTVRGYRNVTATMVGGEVSGNYTWFDALSVPVSMSMVRGRNTEDGRDLPEIPPLRLDAALRYDREQSARPWWLQVGVQYAARQTRVDPLFPENETPSYQVFHVRGGIEVARGVHLEAGIENLFDEDYHEHLTREAVLAGGGLKPGDEIPAPGRYAYVSMNVSF